MCTFVQICVFGLEENGDTAQYGSVPKDVLNCLPVAYNKVGGYLLSRILLQYHRPGGA